MPSAGSGESAAELSLSPMGADGRAVIAVVCRLGFTTRWSILLTLRDLTLPSTFVAGGTLAGIRHWLSWRWPMSHYYFGIKDGHWSRWICVAAICLGLAPKAEAGEHSGLVHRASGTVVRYYVVKYTASAAETWARSKGATEAEIEAARLCLKAAPMQTARITTPGAGARINKPSKERQNVHISKLRRVWAIARISPESSWMRETGQERHRSNHRSAMA